MKPYGLPTTGAGPDTDLHRPGTTQARPTFFRNLNYL